MHQLDKYIGLRITREYIFINKRNQLLNKFIL